MIASNPDGEPNGKNHYKKEVLYKSFIKNKKDRYTKDHGFIC